MLGAVSARTLFDEGGPHYGGPSDHTESAYHYLNRSAEPSRQRIRQLLEGWYAEHHDADDDLRSRFQSDDLHQHIAAWWELYVAAVYRRLGYTVRVHPEIPGTNNKPDFLVTRGPISQYVECVIASGKDTEKNRSGQRYIFDCINKVANPDFMVELEFKRIGTADPRVADITTPLETWLASLDADRVLADLDAGQDYPAYEFDARDWTLSVVAIALSPTSRGVPGRILGVYPGSPVQVIDDVSRIRKALSGKGAKYAALERPLDRPLIVALQCTSVFAGQDDVTKALYGSMAFHYYQHDPGRQVEWFRKRDGYWRQGPPRRGTRVSAVLCGENIRYWDIAAKLPTLFLNPWASRSLAETDGFATVRVQDSGEIVSTAGNLSAPALLGIADNWPFMDDA